MKQLLFALFLALCGLGLYAEMPGKGSALEVYVGMPLLSGKSAVNLAGGEVLRPGTGIKAGFSYLNFSKPEFYRLGFGVSASVYIPFDVKHLDKEDNLKEDYKIGRNGDVLAGSDFTIGTAWRFLIVNEGEIICTAVVGLHVNYLVLQSDRGTFSTGINRINLGVGTYLNMEFHFSRRWYLFGRLAPAVDFLGLYAGEKLTTTVSQMGRTAYYVDKTKHAGFVFAANIDYFLGTGFTL